MRSPPMHTPTAPGLQPFPCAFQTAWRMHFRTPSSVRSARPRCGSSAGSEYWAFVFSQPPPFRISLTSISSLLPLIEVDDRRARAEVVAGVLAGDRIDRIRPQLAAPRRLGDRLADLLPHPDLIRADRAPSPRRSACRCPGRWRLRDRRRLVDVLRDDRQRLRRRASRPARRRARSSSRRGRRAADRSRSGR